LVITSLNALNPSAVSRFFNGSQSKDQEFELKTPSTIDFAGSQIKTSERTTSKFEQIVIEGLIKNRISSLLLPLISTKAYEQDRVFEPCKVYL
jgi:hypothetical protein